MNTVAVAYLAKGPYELTRTLPPHAPAALQKVGAVSAGRLGDPNGTGGIADGDGERWNCTAAGYGADVRANPTPQEARQRRSPSGRSGVQPEGWGTRSPSGYTPAQLRSAYGVESIRFSSAVGDGGGQTIAIVDAYDDPSLVDSSAPASPTVTWRSSIKQFGLPDPPSFVKLNEYGSPSSLPGTRSGGCRQPTGELGSRGSPRCGVGARHRSGGEHHSGRVQFQRQQRHVSRMITAASLPGVSVVSMSWGSSEFSGEQTFDGDFTTPNGHQGVTFVASTGDSGSPGDYPAYSPNVVAVGGTSLYLSNNGSYSSEAGWSGSGGGISTVRNRAGISRRCPEHGPPDHSRRLFRRRPEHRSGRL